MTQKVEAIPYQAAYIEIVADDIFRGQGGVNPFQSYDAPVLIL